MWVCPPQGTVKKDNCNPGAGASRPENYAKGIGRKLVKHGYI